MPLPIPGRPMTADGISDEDVVRRVLSGETSLYEILMRRYNQRLYRVALSILGDHAEAEDVMQDAYVRAYRKLDSFAGEAKFSTWLTKIAVYEALSRLRRRGRSEDLDSIAEAKGSERMIGMREVRDPEQQAYDRELRLVLERAIASLPDAYRSVFVLRVVEGMNTAEAAECLGLTPHTVKTRLHRARLLLRAEIEERAGIAAEQAFSFHLSRCDVIVERVFRRLAAL